MYRSIETDTWSDPWFSELGAPAKLVFLYLVTNGHVDAAGCCEVTLRIMAFETGLEQEQLTKIIPKLAPQVVWWPEHNIFWVRNFLRRQSANTNPTNFRKSATRALASRPGDIGAAVREHYPELPIHEDASEGSPSVKDASPSMPMHSDASPMHAETVSVSVSEPEKYMCASRARFDEAWALYPKKANKAKALAKWIAMPITQELFTTIMAAIRDQATWPQWMGGVVPHMTTWLNGSRWEDEKPCESTETSNPKASRFLTQSDHNQRRYNPDGSLRPVV